MILTWIIHRAAIPLLEMSDKAAAATPLTANGSTDVLHSQL